MAKALDGEWLAFPGFIREEDAKKVFQERFGYEPPEAHRSGPLLLLGPIGTKKKGGEDDERATICD